MEEESKIDIEPVVVLGIRDQLVKLLVCSAVGFLATKVAENAFDNMVKRRLTKTTPINL